MGKGVQIVGLAAVLLGLSSPVQAAVIRPFTSRFSTNDTGDIQIVGNTLVTCPTATSGCLSAQNGTATGAALNNNNYNMINVDVDADSTTFNSSSANFVLPAGATVLWAGLYWGADSQGSINATQRNTVKLATPATGIYMNITATQLDSDNSSGNDYQGFANVTSLVQAGGSGTYTVGNVQVGTGITDRQAGWSLVIVYRDPSQLTRNLTVFDGYAVVNTTTASVSFSVSGFTTPPSGPVTAKIGAVAYEGDRGSTGDNLNFNSTTLTDELNPTSNFFNSSITRTGNNLTNKNPNYTNQLGFDIDVVNLLNTNNSVLGNNATSANINLTTSSEFYQPGVITTAIDIFAPIVAGNVNKSVTDLNGGTVLPGDTLEYTVTVANTGQDGALNNVLTDPIPTNTTYIPGSLQITTGANTGGKTDAAADDQAEYDSTNNRVVFRLGTGATSTAGGTLAANNSTTLKFRVQVNGSTANGTTVSNQATVVYTAQTLGTGFTAQSDGDSATSGIQPTNVVVTLPDMAISKSHIGNFTRGQTGTYTLTATNLGSGTTSGTVTVSDTLPTGLTPTAATGTGWTCTISAQVVTCTRSDALVASNSYPPISLTVNVATTAPASITNTATVSGGGQTNTTNDSVNDPTTIATLPPNLILVKRITAVAGTPSSGFNDLTTGSKAADDNNANWPTPLATYLRGLLNGGSVAPGAEVEYTIYFLNNQNAATNVTICDPIPANLTFVANGYNSASPRPTEPGALPTDTGIALAANAATLPITPTFYLTNANDSDRGRYYPPNDPSTPAACKRVDAAGLVTATGSAANTNGAIVVNVVSGTNQLPPATSSGNPTNSYGYIRFKARVR